MGTEFHVQEGVLHMPYYGYYFDPTYILVVIGMVISLIASAKVTRENKRIPRFTKKDEPAKTSPIRIIGQAA